MKVDFSRHAGVLDHELLSGVRIACIGTGGAAGLVMALSRCGIADWVLVDDDVVSATNIATQDYPAVAIGADKVDVLGAEFERIGTVRSLARRTGRYQDLDWAERALVWSSDIVLAMTDDFHTQARLNIDAIGTGVDLVLAICYPGCAGVEVTASFTDSIAAGLGCYRCHTQRRYDGYAAGYVNPPVLSSDALAATYLNALIGHVVLGRLHAKGGSDLPIAEIGRVFAERPCLIASLVPSFGLGEGEAFAGEAPSRSPPRCGGSIRPSAMSVPIAGRVFRAAPILPPGSW